jgi:hypothetical protein
MRLPRTESGLGSRFSNRAIAKVLGVTRDRHDLAVVLEDQQWAQGV